MLMWVYKILSTFDVFFTTIGKEENQPQTIFSLVQILVISEKIAQIAAKVCKCHMEMSFFNITSYIIFLYIVINRIIFHFFSD